MSVVEMLRKKEQLPVVCFTFSKKRCNENAAQLMSLDLTMSSEKSEITVFIKKSVDRLKGSDRKLPQVARKILTISQHFLQLADQECQIFKALCRVLLVQKHSILIGMMMIRGKCVKYRSDDVTFFCYSIVMVLNKVSLHDVSSSGLEPGTCSVRNGCDHRSLGR